MKKVFGRPRSLKEAVLHYCPGCGHSILHRLVAEVIDEMGIRGIAIGVPPAGCAVLAYNYLDVDMLEAPHGRGCAVATGIKRILPDRMVFSYQGDGDLAAIGTAETLHAANRGENITVVFINNAVYGMTGGQMAPTTLLGQVSTTSPPGRNATLDGHPVQKVPIDGIADAEREDAGIRMALNLGEDLALVADVAVGHEAHDPHVILSVGGIERSADGGHHFSPATAAPAPEKLLRFREVCRGCRHRSGEEHRRVAGERYEIERVVRA
ncbi:MAG TPA: thiamine pyrophosphate-dependent enzyme, partial [Syntrophales bacterium]|nr:thiamine pyrophosphate-dependent enzyme [Syntrophales bacterium]